jgi:hypothetical protein
MIKTKIPGSQHRAALGTQRKAIAEMYLFNSQQR